jgi:DNA-binding response OmpR family regulator
MRRALVVADDPMIARLCTILFRQHGHRALVVRTAQQAVRTLLSPKAIDAAYVDMVLPDGSGRGVAILASRLRPELPVILGSLLPEHLEGRGFIPLVKPFTVATFALAMRAASFGATQVLVPDDSRRWEAALQAESSGGGLRR